VEGIGAPEMWVSERPAAQQPARSSGVVEALAPVR
jgi:hypothetical protein